MRGDHQVKVTEVKELKVNDGIVSGVEEIKNAISEHWKRVGGMNGERVSQQDEMPMFEMEQKRLDEMDGEPCYICFFAHTYIYIYIYILLFNDFFMSIRFLFFLQGSI